MSHEHETAIAFEAGSLVEADLVVALLGENGIPAFIDNESGTVMLDGYIGAQRVVRIRVPAVALEEAREIIRAARSGPSSEEE